MPSLHILKESLAWFNMFLPKHVVDVQYHRFSVAVGFRRSEGLEVVSGDDSAVEVGVPSGFDRLLQGHVTPTPANTATSGAAHSAVVVVTVVVDAFPCWLPVALEPTHPAVSADYSHYRVLL